MFRKRLTTPPAAPEEDHQSRQDVSHIADTIPSSEIDSGESPSEVQNDKSPSQIQNNACPSQIQNGSRDGENRTNSSGSSGIAELEQLLEQKTFTRVEYDRLVELLHSRTVEASNSEREINYERKEKASVSAQKDGIVSSRISIPKDEAASPAELAKAYMDSRPLKTSSVGSQVFQEDSNLPRVPSTSKRLDLSVAPRSVICFSGIPEQPEHGYRIAKPPGRSAIYRMSRSPYFKAGDLSRDGYSSLSSSQWTPSSMKSGGKQVLKRGSSALDGDLGSFGPIRRIRQKSNLMSPLKGPRLTLSEHFLSSPSTPLFKNVSEGSMSIQRPLVVNDQKSDGTGLKAVENGISRPTMLSSQSSETAKKLFQQLDKLVPSPKEKSSEPKIIAQSESPSKVTLDVLHGSALSKMENLISSKSFTAAHQPNAGSSLSQKLDLVTENGPLKSVCLGGKSSSEAHGVSKPSKGGHEGLISESITVATSVEVPVPKKPSFQMSAPEESLELDDDDYKRKKFNSPLTTGNDDADTKMSKQINVISETAFSGNPIKTSSQSMPVSTSMPSSRKADKKALQPVVTEKNNGFAFPIVSDPCSQFQPPPTPTMPTPLLDRPDVPKEQTSPIFSFESKDANSSTISSTDVGVNGSVGIKVGEGSRSELKLSTSAPTTCAEISPLDKNEKENVGSLSKSYGNIVSSGLSALPKPSVFGLGTSSSPNLNNGSLHSSLTTSPVSSESLSSSIFVNSTGATSNSSSSFASSTAPTSTTINSFQIGSGGDFLTSAPFSFSQPLDKPNSSTLGANSLKGSQFGISSSMSHGTSTVFASTGSSSSHVSTPISIFSSGGSSSALSTSAMSNSSFAASSLFSSMPGISSPIAVSSAFPSTISNTFGFNASTQSTISGLSFANSSSQIPVATVFGATGGSTSSSPLFGNISSQNSVASTVSATEGSVFGTQSTQSPQSSISQFGSFSSSPSFSLGKSSSSSGFGISSLTPANHSSSGVSFSSGFGSSTANSSSSFAAAATPSLFSSSSQASTPSVFVSTSNSNTSSSTGFSFGLSASASSTSPFTFGPSSGSGFSFTSASTTTASNPSSVPTFREVPNPATGFGSSSPGNDQMNEDSMTDDTTQAATLFVPSFGQPTNPSPSQPFVFGSPAVQPGAPSPFQFGGQQSPLPQNPSPFQPTGSVEFNAGGSFSLGGGGGDKSGRRFVKVKRDKRRK
ncbi:nuclear pore complex protein NUP1-like isoform X2 [Asparagus officinalis]|uniref:nuclear pore complex protein NUP1-like isoform X2 n=1 Tax=Asparagus officinalis TaxID=4686 RepID=UPI00098E85DF|nr:nuclear pore complex protein NUP1-like isoform X2 [Asparagus officinalis]